MRRLLSIPAVVTLSFLAGTLTADGQSPDPLVGTWTANIAKSTYSPGPPPTTKSDVSTWETLGGGQSRNTQVIVDTKGLSTRTEVVTRFDGAEVPMKGAAVPTTRAYKRIDARTFEFVTKENGKVTTTTRSVASPDGKIRTNTTTGTDARGQSVKNVVLWEKQ
jgi:hypothetical protein